MIKFKCLFKKCDNTEYFAESTKVEDYLGSDYTVIHKVYRCKDCGRKHYKLYKTMLE